MSAKTHPAIVYPADLPISQVIEEIRQAISQHSVVIVAGETGSGKSTQLPKLCLDMGRGQSGLIGCTQPRRIAARSVARRVAEEMGSELGQRVGFQVRFREQSSSATQLKFMTDGILLSEIQSDRDLRRYDTLIIDEAHERSLNIDFLLGYLKRLTQRRADLKVIITSATINTEKFSAHFANAPVISVEGRGYPVEIEYQPPSDNEPLPQQVKRAIDRLSQIDPRGDVLVFLPGEREIFEVARWLRKSNLRHTEVLPLYARLPNEAQDKVFSPGSGRRIVLATNVAETSLTVPGIRFVIDSGLARISRYTAHSRVLRLPIEPVSQAACQQRSGRCGRIGPGLCIRLFEESDFIARAQFSEPEILRASLVGVILQMRALDLGDPEDFPLIDQPPKRLLGEAWQTLYELGAVDEHKSLTKIGKTLARLPIDARFGRMLLEAEKRQVIEPVIVLVASMSIGDVRDRPLEQQQAADQAHQEFVVTGSDFLTQLKIWDWWQQTKKEHGTHQTNKKAKAKFLAPNRLHEWSQLYRQLKDIASDEGWKTTHWRKDWEIEVHRSLLSGLLGLVGRLDDQGIYEGVRGHRFKIFPGSVLAKAQPAWIMSAERVETGQTYARMATGINVEWLVSQAQHLLKRRVFDPYWSKRTGRVMGYEQLSLHGLIVVPKKRIHYGPYDPTEARRLFIRHALAEGQINFNAEFIRHNESLKALLSEHEHKQRRRDVLASEDALIEFFDQRLPSNIYTTKAFIRWYEKLDEASKDQWLLDQATLLRDDSALADVDAFPDQLKIHGEFYRLHYCFDPTSPDDGITLDCPLHLLNQLDEGKLEWLVPGLLHEKVAALIASLRKSQRRLLVPIKDYANAAVEALGKPEGGLLTELSLVLSKLSGLTITPADFNLDKLPKHLSTLVRVFDISGAVLGQSRDLVALKSTYESQARAEFMARQASQWQRDGLKRDDLEPLPVQITTPGGHQAWPAWVAQGAQVGIRLFDTQQQAQIAHLEALALLCRQELADKLKYLKKNHGLSHAAQVAWATQEPIQDLLVGLVDQLIDEMIEQCGGAAIRDQRALLDCVEVIRQHLISSYQAAVEVLGRVIIAWHQCLMRARDLEYAAPNNIADVFSQLEDLVYPGFISAIATKKLSDYERYLKALTMRLDGLELDPKKDWDRVQQLMPFWSRYLDHLNEGHWYTNALDDYRWALEEYRIQLFAQSLGTKKSVSPKRLGVLWEEVLSET